MSGSGRNSAKAPFAYDVRRYYLLRVENDGPRIRAYVDGKLVIEAEDGEMLSGKAGVIANIPARFQEFAVTASGAAKAEIDSPHRRAGGGTGAAAGRESDGPSCGRSSRRPVSAPAATSASATWTATASPTC